MKTLKMVHTQKNYKHTSKENGCSLALGLNKFLNLYKGGDTGTYIRGW